MSQKANPSTQPPQVPSVSSPATAPPPSGSTPFSPSSSFSKCVLLLEWWLLKSDTDSGGKRLAVGGLNAYGKQVTRVFTSAPIVTRFDAYTVETADGITVRIQGFINKARTHLNGVPPEVSQCFLIGFPYNWDKYANGDFWEKPDSPAVSMRSSGISRQLEQGSSDISAVERDSSNLLPIEREDPHHKLERGLGGYELRSRDRSRKTGMKNTVSSESSIGRKDCDEGDANSLKMKRSMAFEPSAKAPNERGNSRDSRLVIQNECRSVTRKHTIHSGIVKHCGIKHANSVAADVLQEGHPHFSPEEPGSEHQQETPVSRDVINKKCAGHSEHDDSLRKRSNSVSVKTVIQCSVKRTNHSGSTAQLHLDRASDLTRKSTGELPGICDSGALTDEELTRRKKEHASTRKTIWKPSYSLESPLTRDKAKKLSVTSPELLDLKRSRSGRLLVPALARWCQKIIYDTDGSITGLSGLDELNAPCKGSRSEQPKRRKPL
ncbi:uncharacterized protein A4U43_C02F15570 [Asparagus officinalis]|uniref:SANTA domain-containing protein n=1 Tax=Asparagus officinalis TaxID=4686 RepID=A0A5P1FMJ3_ASPOF|nr:uncharacterized protein A4U43_C02F15570 [Asparagus officinalis]